jgi:hypothetical protein
VSCPQVGTVGVDVLAGVEHTLIGAELIGGLYALTVLTVALVTLITRNDTRRKTGLKILNVLLKIKPKRT